MKSEYQILCTTVKKRERLAGEITRIAIGNQAEIIGASHVSLDRI